MNTDTLTNYYEINADDYALVIAALRRNASYLSSVIDYYSDMLDFVRNYEKCWIPEIESDENLYKHWVSLYNERLDHVIDLIKKLENNRDLLFPFIED